MDVDFEILTAWYRAGRPVSWAAWNQMAADQRLAFVTASELTIRLWCLTLARCLVDPAEMERPLDGGASAGRAQLLAAMQAELERRAPA